MNLKAKYEALIADLYKLEKSTGLYLADESVDMENVLEGKPQEVKELLWNGWLDADHSLYAELYSAAGMAAGMRAEEHGLSINEMLGYQVY